jgi:hypothetical protein
MQKGRRRKRRRVAMESEKLPLAPGVKELVESSRLILNNVIVAKDIAIRNNELFERVHQLLVQGDEFLRLILVELREKPQPIVPHLPKVMDIQSRLLNELKSGGGGTAEEIANRCQLPASSTSPGLYRLWARGLVTQERIPSADGKHPKSYYKLK